MTNHLPGFGLPIRHPPYPERLLAHAATDDGVASLLTARELWILGVVNDITETEGWERKVFDPDFVKRWHQDKASEANSLFSERAFNWCVAELREKAELYEQTGFVAVLDAETEVLKSDRLIPEELRKELLTASESLRVHSTHSKDLDPGSSNPVLNYIDPSLFPLVYGRTRVLENGRVGFKNCVAFSGMGRATESQEKMPERVFRGRVRPVEGPSSTHWSDHYQWLPCDVKLGPSGAAITSYINNLHPSHHGRLYSAIERVIDKVIPLWNACFSKDSHGVGPRIQNATPTYDPPSPEQTIRQSLPGLNPYEIWRTSRKLLHPEPPAFPSGPKPWRCERIDLREDFREEGLQVIVKLMRVEHSQEKPISSESQTPIEWNVEGLLNEHIVATAIYYFDHHNVTEGGLEFRQATRQDDSLTYYRNDFGSVGKIYNTRLPGGPRIQELGHVLTKEGRVVAFPNTLQRRVEHFDLIDRAQPGYQEILLLGLVDPNIRILSTSSVPPQQRTWWEEEVLKQWQRLRELPTEILRMIFDLVDDSMISIEEAQVYRSQMMEERASRSEFLNLYMTSQRFNQWANVDVPWRRGSGTGTGY